MKKNMQKKESYNKNSESWWEQPISVRYDKPLPTGCIKENLDVSWRTFNLLLEKVSLNDQIGHIYVVDIKFDHKNASENQIVYNEIYLPIAEKQKIIDPCERSVISWLRRKKVVHKHIKQLKKHTRPYSKKKIHPM